MASNNPERKEEKETVVAEDEDTGAQIAPIIKLEEDAGEEDEDAILDLISSEQEMELTMIGLQNAGKTSLSNVIATGLFKDDMTPTPGFNMQKVMKGKVTVTMWDVAGQPKYRMMWKRYCRGASAIVYVVDVSDHGNLSVSKTELDNLLSKPSLEGIPLLVLGNKIDKDGALSKDALTDEMGLKYIVDREVCCFMISCKNKLNLDTVIDWLIRNFQDQKLKEKQDGAAF